MIIRLASNRYVGLSTDTKPTTNVETGAFFSESDTGNLYTWDGSSWKGIPLDHRNLLPGNIHVPYDYTFPTAAARIAASYSVSDIGKFIRQTDSDDIYMLTNNSPNQFVKVSGSGTGEPNTASNIGASGIGWYKQKSTYDLQFKNIDAGSDKISLFDDPYNNVIIVDVDQDEIETDELKVDYTPSNYTPPSPTDELGSHLKGIDDKLGDLAATQGETNTASNVGTGGLGWFYQKSGVVLQFKNAYAGSGINITDDVGNKRLNITVQPDVTTGGDVAPVNVIPNGTGLNVTELNGDHLRVDWVPSNYTRDTSPSEAGDIKDLTSHLAGIDNEIGGLGLIDNGNKQPVRLATVAALPAYTALGAGVGKKLQANANGALSIDGIAVITNDRVLIKNETGANQIHNGIYDVINPGNGSNKYVLQRTVDYDEDTEIVSGHLIQASEGNTNLDTPFILTTNEPISIESSYLIYDNANKQGITSITNIAASANITVDSVLLSAYHSAKWIMEVYDATASKREASEVIARELSLAVSWAQPAQFVVGDSINYTISFSSDGTSMSFKIQNNESNTITVRLRKFEV